MYLTLRHLQYFAAVVRAGSMARAAQTVHVAPTALSLQIKAIEDQSGVRLLTRHSRGIAPTEAGTALLERAEAVLALVAEAERELAARAAPAAGPVVIRLGLQPSQARRLGYDVMAGIGRVLPRAELRLAEGWSADIERRLDAGELDAVVGYGVGGRGVHPTFEICEDPFYFVAAPGFAGGAGPIALREVLGRPLAFYGEKGVSWRLAQAAAAREGVPVAQGQQIESVELWRAMICRGRVGAIASYSALADEHRRGEVVVRPFEGEPLTVPVRLCVHEAVAAAPWVAPFRDLLARLLVAARPEEAQTAVKPPSSISSEPLTIPDASEAR